MYLFSLWYLTRFIQKNNPNVSNISDKLHLHENRSLINAKKIWNTYFDVTTTFRCIYSGEQLFKNDFHIDHFLPWSFTGHNQLWNLIPASKASNSSKSDNLPSEIYLEKYYAVQYEAFHCIAKQVKVNAKFLEDYSILFKDDIANIKKINEKGFTETLKKNIKPLKIESHQSQLIFLLSFFPGVLWLYSYI